jgi:hypothetical protein
METLDREDLKKALKGERIGRLSKEHFKTIRKEIAEKLKPLEITYGIKFNLGRIRFDEVSFRGKLEGTLLTPSGGDSSDAILFKNKCHYYGLQPSDFGKEVKLPRYSKFPGRRGKISGINTRAKKYPIIITLEDGTQTKNAVHFIKELLK